MPYDFGDPVPITVEVRDLDGNLADADLVVVTITHPDQVTTETPPVDHPSLGRYQVDYYPPTPGRYAWRANAIGNATSAYADSFDVSDPLPNSIISLLDARDTLRLSSTVEDEDLRLYVESTTAIIERHLNQVVVRRTITEDYRVGAPTMGDYYPGYYYGGGGSNYPSWYYRDSAAYAAGVTLKQTPVVSLVSVASLDGLRTWNISDLHVDTNTGLVTPLPATASLWGPITITYIAGYQTIPANYQQAARFILQDLWASRRGGQQQVGRGETAAARQGDIRWGVLAEGPGMKAALELLGPPLPSIA